MELTTDQELGIAAAHILGGFVSRGQVTGAEQAARMYFDYFDALKVERDRRRKIARVEPPS